MVDSPADAKPIAELLRSGESKDLTEDEIHKKLGFLPIDMEPAYRNFFETFGTDSHFQLDLSMAPNADYK